MLMLGKAFSHCACAAIMAGSVLAGPLDKTKVAHDAKWLVHLDFEAFRASQLGAHVTEKVVAPRLRQSEAAKKHSFSMNARNISGITAYGSAFEAKTNGVLVVSTTADVKGDLDRLVGIALVSGGDKVLSMVQKEPYPLYSLNEDLFFAPGKEMLVVARSREQIARARDVALGKANNLSRNGAFAQFPEAPQGHFLVGIAEGLNHATGIPPQAQVLRESQGARFAMGEKEKEIFLNLVLQGRDDESTTKIHQVFQGILALISLSQQNSDLTELAANTDLAASGRNVSVNVNLPVSRAIQKIDEKSN